MEYPLICHNDKLLLGLYHHIKVDYFSVLLVTAPRILGSTKHPAPAKSKIKAGPKIAAPCAHPIA